MTMTAQSTAYNRKALVTGGATGIGWAICQMLAAQDITVVIADINISAAQERAAQLGRDHKALEIDLADHAAAAVLPCQAAELLGGLDIIVNNAGITDTSGRRIGEIPRGDFDRLVAINFGSVAAICKAGREVLGQGGVIVNLASGAAFQALPLRGAYSATKSGVVALTRHMNAEAATFGQRVSAIAPGYVRTELVESLITNGRLDPLKAAATIPLGRLGTPEDIANGAGFLISHAGALLAGRCLGIDGGSFASGGAIVRPQEETAADTPASATVLIGAPDVTSPVANGMDANHAVQIADVSDLNFTGPVRALLDLGGLLALTPETALARARDMAEQVEQLSPSRGFCLLLTVRANDAISVATMGMITRVLALELAPKGYRVNTISWSGETTANLGSLVAWLSSDVAGYVTGQLLEAEDFE